MTRENTKRWLIQYAAMGFDPLDTDKWLIMQAYSNGADIERTYKGENKWQSASDPAWQWGVYDYRVKQISIRPYTIYELVGILHSRASNEIVHKITGQSDKINRIDFDDFTLPLSINHEWLTLKDLIDTYTWPDGTPCGVKL